MKQINDNLSQPLRFVDKGKIIGQFYNTRDCLYHLAEYVPYERLPSIYLCGDKGNFSPSREERNDRRICSSCWLAVVMEVYLNIIYDIYTHL